jgi:hypothetical protein
MTLALESKVTHRVLHFSLFFSPPLPRSAASSFSASTAPTAQAMCEAARQLNDTKDYVYSTRQRSFPGPRSERPRLHLFLSQQFVKSI